MWHVWDMPKRRWEGGYVHLQKDGRELFIIERRVGKDRFHVSTRCHSRRAAIKQLEQFEADPHAYVARMKEGADDGKVLRLTSELIDEYETWLLKRARPTTPRHAQNMGKKLEEWMEDLAGTDLRSLDLRTLKALVEKRPAARQHRIIAIKAFFAWLRTAKFLIERRDDATLDLAVPQAVPEKHKRRKAVAVEQVRAALRHLAPAYRDCLLLLAHTGWHVSELERFVRNEDAVVAEGRGGVLGVLQVRHKIGHTTRTPVLDAAVLEAAKRLRARGEVPRRLNQTIIAACVAAGVETFTAGVMRHSVATWAIEAGTQAEVVAEFLGHKSKSTTLRFYADVAVPTPPIKLPKLVD